MTPLLSTFSAASARGFGRGGGIPSGQQLYTTSGTYTFTVPPGVISISVVCVGGGQGGARDVAGAGAGLAYSNNISVTAGELLTVTVGAGSNGVEQTTSPAPVAGNSTLARGATTLVLARGGGASTAQVGDVTNLGGAGGTGGLTGDGGGGAAGYAGTGGKGGAFNNTPGDVSTAGTGGAGGGGGGAQSSADAGGGGGGVGLVGQGTDGAAGARSQGGGGGSGGTAGGNAFSTPSGGAGGTYGGGAGGAISNAGVGGNGGSGGVRIIWGVGRSYPSNAADV
jgi:hypothetical protein